MDVTPPPPTRDSIGAWLDSQGVELTDDETLTVEAMIGGIWPLVCRMREVPLPYVDAAGPAAVMGWIEAGGRGPAEAR